MRDKKMEQTIKGFVILILFVTLVIFVTTSQKEAKSKTEEISIKVENVEYNYFIPS